MQCYTGTPGRDTASRSVAALNRRIQFRGSTQDAHRCLPEGFSVAGDIENVGPRCNTLRRKHQLVRPCGHAPRIVRQDAPAEEIRE